jgi:RimJ/RimL family protein N-acetyltransferase
MNLRTHRLILRELVEADFSALHAYQSSPEMYRYEPGALSADDTRAFLTHAMAWATEQPRTRYYLGVETQTGASLLGHVSLKLLNPEIREWEVGWYIQRAMWGKGIATEAARELVNYAFIVLDAHRVVAYCQAANSRSVRVMEKLGMQRDGVLRESLYRNGAWQDEFVYAILDREWEAWQVVEAER